MGGISDAFKSVTDTLFGDQGAGAQKRQEKENIQSREFIREAVAEARQSIAANFPSVGENRLLGSQGALDILGQTVPAQLNAFVSGNVLAQERLGQGLPQIQNALLGLPVDTGFAQQTRRVPVDASIFQRQLPNFNTGVALGGQATPPPQGRPSPEQVQAFVNALTTRPQATRDFFGAVQRQGRPQGQQNQALANALGGIL